MSIVKVDRRGRITLPKKLRESLGIGEKVLIMNMGDHLQIIPLPSDPFEALEDTLSINKTFKELRKQAELVAEKDATDELS
ncbi:MULTISPECIES: division/cell wall cluster transcriptional repressor MraZ [Thermofilum]|nr:division/cell wall cluster transcriptional repressor MraZ [Thermofilum adornatum]